MDPSLTKEEQEVHDALLGFGMTQTRLSRLREYYGRLHDKGYWTIEDFREATRDGLRAAGLTEALLDAFARPGGGGDGGNGGGGGGGGGEPAPLSMSPSDFGKDPSKYDAGEHVAIQRPYIPAPRVLPPQLMFQPFAKFVEDLHSAVPTANHDALVKKLVTVLGLYYPKEKDDRAPPVRDALSEVFQLAGLEDVLVPTERGDCVNDGSTSVKALMREFKYCILEIKNELGKSGDGWLQLAAYGDKEVARITPQEREALWPCPMVCIEAVGSHLRIIGSMWAGPGSGFLVRSAALTPLLPFQRLDTAHMELLSRFICALVDLLPAVKNHYTSVEFPMRHAPSQTWSHPPPWPLLQLLKDNFVINARHFQGAGARAMYLAELTSKATPVVIKFIEHVGEFRGAEVQIKWSGVGTGAAPTLHLHRALGAGFHMVVYDFKDPKEGWSDAWQLKGESLDAVRSAAAAMLEEVQRIHPDTVHGDLRRCNTLWRRQNNGKMEICFVDFDRSGPPGKPYPGFISMGVYTHAAFVQPREGMYPSHDTALINAWPSEPP